MNETIAQVTDTNTQPATQDGQAVSPITNQQHTGIQARIDELTARAKQAETQNAELVQRMMEMSTQALQAKAPVQAPVDPLAQHREALDPRLIEVLEAQKLQFERQLQARTDQLEIAMGKNQIHEQARAMPGLKPEVINKAVQLYEQSRANGMRPRPEEALFHVLGLEYAQQMRQVAPVAGIPQTAFNSYQPVQPHVQPAPTPSFSLPANFDNLPLDQQLLLLEKAGVGDKPI